MTRTPILDGQASEAHFDAFEAWARSVHAENTAEAYGSSARKFRAAIPCTPSVAPDGAPALAVIPSALRDFVQRMHEAELSASSIRLHVSGAMSYLEWLRESGVRVPELKRPKLPEVKETEVPRLSPAALDAYDAEASTKPEPYATALRLLPLTGLRVGELCAIKGALLDLVTLDPLVSIDPGGLAVLAKLADRAYVIRVPREASKGNAGRDVSVFPARGNPLLDRYVGATWASLPGYRRSREYLFPVADGGPISASTVQGHMRDIRGQLGIPDLTPHTFRHYVATVLIENGMSTLQVQHHMGHANASTTARYVRNASLASRQREIARIDPSER